MQSPLLDKCFRLVERRKQLTCKQLLAEHGIVRDGNTSKAHRDMVSWHDRKAAQYRLTGHGGRGGTSYIGVQD